MTSERARTRLLSTVGLVACLILVETAMNVVFAQETPAAPLTADQVVQRMVEGNARRAGDLARYRGTRSYHLEYDGLSKKSATLLVAMTYRSPDEKSFCILSESGSEFLQRRVLKRLLEVESDATREEQGRQMAMSPENYEFRLVGDERILDHEFYILEVTPRTKNKFLLRGRIWVEGQDFAVARVEGQPAENPSWWTKRNIIHMTYEKIGEFWLPARSETNTQVRILGHSVLTIVYSDYEIPDAGGVQMTSSSGNALACPAEPVKLSDTRP
jgi:hypothetical protein